MPPPALRHPCLQCHQPFSRKDALVRHTRTKHGVDRPWPCTLCPRTYQRKDVLRRHMHAAHLNRRVHRCTLCTRAFCRADKLREHKEHVHDQGDHLCGACCHQRHSRIPLHGIHVCRACYRRATGHASRAEHRWSAFLDTHFGTHFLMGSDLSLQAMGACSRARPDKLWGSPGALTVCGELDEHWHRGHLRDCEEARMSDIAEQVGGKVVFLRLNPHLRGPTMEQRFRLYLQVLQQILDDPPEPLVSVVYVCYPQHAHNLATRWPRRMVGGL